MLEDLLIDSVKKVRGYDIVIYDMESKNPFYDKMIIATVDSVRQANACISYIEDNLKDTKYKIRKVEGENTSWVLVDCYEVILSVFTKEEREHFSLDKLYMDIKQQRLENED